MTLYDLTPKEFIMLVINIITIMLYLSLGVKIIQLRKYLKWNIKIYPSMVISAFGISSVLIYNLNINELHNINPLLHIFMWMFALNQFSELFNLVSRYNVVKELKNKIDMKDTSKLIMFLIFIISLYSSVN